VITNNKRQASIIFIFITLVIDIIGLGIVIPILPELITEFAGGDKSNGIMGASFTTANAYIADISTPENRAQNFGLVGVAFGLGFTFGPVIGGFLGGCSSFSLSQPHIWLLCITRITQTRKP